MSRADRLRAAGAWIAGPRGLMALAVTLLFVLMAASFLNVPWGLPAERCGGDLCDVPATPTGTGGSIAGDLFGDYAVLVLLIALVLAACMIGGVYLAKSEGGP